MGCSQKYPFQTETQVIHYYHHNKRGRQKAIDVLDQEIRSTPDRVDLRWEVCCLAVTRGLDGMDRDKRRAFEMRYFVDYDDRATITDVIDAIGKEFGKGRRTIYDWLDEAREHIRWEAEELELIPGREV